MVLGSRTTPLSYFFTCLTAFACSAIEQFLCKTPKPPASAKAIAIRASVTVSIAAETKGNFNLILVESFVVNETSLGRKLL